jgi:hypothetical protein
VDKHRLRDEQLQIPPGFILLERSRDHVLCFCPNGTLGRYATWAIGQDGILHTGNYFSSPKSAAIDFEGRAGR